MPLNSFHDLNKFIDILNNEFGSGYFMFGGNVKLKDLVEYGRWLNDSFYFKLLKMHFQARSKVFL